MKVREACYATDLNVSLGDTILAILSSKEEVSGEQ